MSRKAPGRPLLRGSVPRGYWVYAAVALLLAGGCSERQARRAGLSEDAVVHLFAGMVQVTFAHASQRGALRAGYAEVAREYGLSEEDVRELPSRFEKHPERWVSVLEGVLEELTGLAERGAI